MAPGHIVIAAAIAICSIAVLVAGELSWSSVGEGFMLTGYFVLLIATVVSAWLVTHAAVRAVMGRPVRELWRESWLGVVNGGIAIGIYLFLAHAKL